MKKFIPKIKLVGITILFFVISLSISYAETFSLSSLESDEICRRDYVIEYASQLNRLENCKAVKGNLTINNTQLKNLDALVNLQYVGGNFTIKYNEELENVSGLKNLKEIGLDLRLYNNKSLVDLEGLGSLQRIGDDLSIEGNDKLMDISAFGELTIEDTFEINDNITLENLKGLKDVVVNGISIRIISNDILPTCEAERFANSLQENGLSDHVSVDIIDNDDEGECVEETNCESDIVIQDSLDLESMKHCTVVSGNLTIVNTDLTDLEGLNDLYYIEGDLTILNNDVLENILALSNLRDIDGNLRIGSNDSLVTLDGLNSIKSLRSLKIARNSNLKDLSALSNITVAHLIKILANNALESLEDLENVIFNGSLLEIKSNNSLPTCYAENFVENLKENGWSGETVISGNNDDASACVQENLCETDVVIDASNDLENIKNCSVIEGSLTIKNTELTNLAGLENLYFIGGSLKIMNNPQLVSISALSDLQNIAGNLQILNNDSLFDLNGLGSISSVDALEISYNDEMKDLSVLGEITVNEQLKINGNDSLTSVEDLMDITLNGLELEIAFNSNLPTCKIEEFVTDLQDKGWLGEAEVFENNDDASDCVQQNLCETDVVIYNNNDLEKIENCFAIEGSLAIKNTQLTTLEGLENLYYVKGTLKIIKNSKLVSISALSDLQNIAGDLYILNNDSLVNLNGLGSIDSAGIVDISYNAKLKDLSGLGEITVNEQLKINGNNSLKSLEGLKEITLNGSELEIAFNSNLPTCNAEDFVSDLQEKGWSGEALITKNDDEACVVEKECDGDFYIYHSSDLEKVKNCTVINGDLDIDSTDFTDLEMFKHLREVKGDLTISRIKDLESLSGLRGLKEIGYFKVNDNESLIILDGLDSLERIGDDLRITNNANLKNIGDFGNLIIYDNIHIEGNTSLESIEGLMDVSIEGTRASIEIEDNNSLPTCAAEKFIEMLKAKGWSQGDNSLIISGNDDNGTCGEVEESVCDTNVFIANMNDLENVKNCTVIKGHLRIKDSKITNLDNLKNLTIIKGSLKIVNNNKLRSLSGLNNLKKVLGNVLISDNDILKSLDGLNGLVEIGLRDSFYTPIYDYAGLDKGGDLQISNNSRLRSVSGLENLKYLANFECVDNIQLSTCKIKYFVETLKDNDWSGEVVISGNSRICE